MSNRPQSAEPSPAFAERRQSPRVRLPSLGYVELGKNNGGILLNFSEGGLAVASATPLSTDSVGQMRFQIPGSRDWLEANGEVAWLSESKREAGIRFVDLPEEAREKIRNWISSPAAMPPTKTSPVREKAWRRLDASTLTMPVSIADARPVQPPQPTHLEPFPETQTGTRVPIYGVPTHRIFFRLVANDLRVLFRMMTHGWGLVVTPIAIVGLILLGFAVGKARKANSALMRDALNQSEAVPVPLGNVPSFSQHPVSADQGSSLSPSASQAANPFQGSSSPASGNADSARSTEAVDTSDSDPDIARMRQRLADAESHLRSSAPATPASQPVARSTNSTLPAGSTVRNANTPSPPVTSASAQQAARNTAWPAPAPAATQPATTNPVVAPPKPAPPKNTISVSINGLPSIRVPAGLKSQSSQGAAPLQIGQLLSRVDPVYPPDAEAQRIEGTVQLHVLIGPDGMIENVQPKSGPSLLIPAAVSAVRQWSYTPSFVGGQPAEAEEDIAITFGLAK